MKKLLFVAGLAFFGLHADAQKKSRPVFSSRSAALTATVPAEVQGTWMYGNFSLTDYWSKSPRTYLGNAFTFAVAFRFNANGSYEHYFVSSTVTDGLPVYHQSVTKGTFTVDDDTKTITTFPQSAHYKRTSLGTTEEDRDLQSSEITRGTSYSFATGTEPGGTKALHLTMQGTQKALTFLQK